MMLAGVGGDGGVLEADDSATRIHCHVAYHGDVALQVLVARQRYAAPALRPGRSSRHGRRGHGGGQHRTRALVAQVAQPIRHRVGCGVNCQLIHERLGREHVGEGAEAA